MDYTIEQVLGNKYLMFYHSAWPCNKLRAVCNVEKSVLTVNKELISAGKNLSIWPAFAQDEIARLLWVNWIYQRLVVEPIRKPILAHYDNGEFIVDCGDTRLMALNLLNNPPTVSVVVTARIEDASIYNEWVQVRNHHELIAASKFSKDTQVLIRPSVCSTHAIEWLEIGNQTTSHHLHDVVQRTNMMQRYLDLQPVDFRFDSNWPRSEIDWDFYLI